MLKNNRALSLALPIMLGYAPVAWTFGLLAFQQKVGIGMTMAFSMLVYAGSAQFAALGAIGAGIVSFPQVFVMVFLINLRHFMLSLAYLPNVKTWSPLQKLRLFSILTDENFAVLAGSDDVKRDPKTSYAVSLFTYGTWATFTLIGYCFGTFVPNTKALGLDFALSAMFIGIIVLFLNSLEQAVALVSAILFMMFFYFVLDCGRSSVIVAALLASLIGWRVECRRKTV